MAMAEEAQAESGSDEARKDAKAQLRVKCRHQPSLTLMLRLSIEREAQPRPLGSIRALNGIDIKDTYKTEEARLAHLLLRPRPTCELALRNSWWSSAAYFASNPLFASSMF